MVVLERARRDGLYEEMTYLQRLEQREWCKALRRKVSRKRELQG